MMNLTQFENWLNKLPRWQKYTINVLQKKISLADTDIADIAQHCLDEINGLNIVDTKIDIMSFVPNKGADILQLKSISNVKNVNALSPVHPLDFSKENITIVYGSNGSGKSSYVRLLKNACSARTKGKILGNIYSPIKETPQAVFSYSLNGTDKTASWQENTTCPDMSAIDIFDSTFSGIFIKSPTTVSYEPPVLAFFSLFIETCEKVAVYLQGEIDKISDSKIPQVPPNLSNTDIARRLSSITSKTTVNDIDNYFCFSDNDKANIADYTKRLSEQNPAEQARQLRQKQDYIKEIVESIKILDCQFAESFINNILAITADIGEKENISILVSQSLKESSQFEGVGNNIWKTLWQAAREYSEQYAYQGKEYPNTDEGARCVLCHQLLDKEAAARFRSFDEYINGVAEKELGEAKQKLTDILGSMVQVLTDDTLAAKLQAANIIDDNILVTTKALFSQFRISYDAVQSLSGIEALLPVKTDNVVHLLEKVMEHYKQEILKYEEDSKTDNRTEMQNACNELQAKKWVNENKSAVLEEIERLKKVTLFKEAKNSANTREFSLKKGELSEELITIDFVSRFNTELKKLSASKVKVEFVKDSVSKGKVLHKVILKNVKTPASPDAILSEGEYRIVVIAAFLADVMGRKANVPFIFDDPISSLDQDYEEVVVQRIIELSFERQIIVFTHRLSFLGSIRHYADKKDIKYALLCIRALGDKVGEPSALPNSQSEIKYAIDSLSSERIEAIKRLQTNSEFEEADIQLQAVCSEFRTLIERSIESDLLCGVVQRFQRPVSTLKLKYLAKLTKEDCAVLDSLMTKYSGFEHSQSEEAPVLLPSVQDLATDIQALQTWRKEYLKRTPPPLPDVSQLVVTA